MVIDVHPAAHEAVSAFLFDLGCKGVVIGEEGKASLKAYLPVTERVEELRSRLEVFLDRVKEFFPEVKEGAVHLSTIQDEDWSLNWRRHFLVERITENLTVVPVWEPVPLLSGGIVIGMDPGPAFGTGSHPTTRMCLQGIERFHTPGEWSLLDVGTGSGILAIYATKLGAAGVVAIDTDPEALRWAEQNIALNQCSGSIELSSKPVNLLRGGFCMLVANLTRDALLQLLPEFRRLLADHGTLILSGLLREQVREVKNPIEHLGFKDLQVVTQAEWACITAQKTGRMEY